MRLTGSSRKQIVSMAVISTLSIIGLIFIFALNLFATINALALFIFAFVILSGLIYFYTGDDKGPIGLRGKYAKPFGMAGILMVIGVMTGFLIYFNMDKYLDFGGQLPLAMAAAGLGILFGMAAFLRLYRREM